MLKSCIDHDRDHGVLTLFGIFYLVAWTAILVWFMIEPDLHRGVEAEHSQVVFFYWCAVAMLTLMLPVILYNR
jgi:hypothetical protein